MVAWRVDPLVLLVLMWVVGKVDVMATEAIKKEHKQ